MWSWRIPPPASGDYRGCDGTAEQDAEPGGPPHPSDIEAIGRELDEIRQSVLDGRGARDAAYIRRVIDTQRKLEIAGRVLLLASRYRPAWVLGTACLTAAKILDNMEIGHNVLHGQWDWMRDPKIHSSTWEWDHASPAAQWKRAHNVQHHTFTNILGKDNDLGYGIMRVDEDQPWKPRYLAQPLWNFVNACIFEYGIAMYDIEIGDHLRQKRGCHPELRSRSVRRWPRRAGRSPRTTSCSLRSPGPRGAAPSPPT